MRKMSHRSPRSISRNVSVGLAVLLLTVSGTGLYTSSRLSASRAQAELAAKADEYLDSLAESLVIPLWNYDRDTAQAIGEAYAQNEFLAILRIEGGTDEGDGVMTTFFRLEQTAPSFEILKTRDILYQGALVGRVALALTAGYDSAIQRRFFRDYSIGIVLMMGVVLIGTKGLLRLFFRQPLRHFTRLVNAYADGDTRAFDQGMPYREFQPFTAVLQHMGATISGQVRALQQAEHKYRTIFENAAEGMYQTTREGKILACNPALAHILGYDSPEEVLTAIITVQEQVYVNGTRRDEFLSIMGRERAVTDFEARFYRQDRSIIWVVLNARSVYDETGRLVYYEGLLQDITQRKQAEEELRHNERLLRTIAANYPHSYLSIIEADFTVGFTSGQEFAKTGLNPESFVGLTLEQVFGEHAPLVKVQYAKTFQGEEISFELFINQQFQSYKTVPLYDEDGNIPRILSVVENITERKQTEAKILQQVEELQRWYRLMVGREAQIQALKCEVNDLLHRLHEPIRYPSQAEPAETLRPADNDLRVHSPSPDIPPKLIEKWQALLNLLAALIQVPAALIMKVEPPEITVFVASHSEGNPYERGEKASLNTGLYCETVMRTRQRLLVPNALEDDEWKTNPDIELGMISYLGFPVTWPNGTIFGTICVLDRKTNAYNSVYQELLEQFRAIVETDLELFFDHDVKLMEAQRVKLEESEQARGALLSVLEDQKQIEQELQVHREHLEELVQERTRELEAKTKELETFNKAMINRELRMIEMKEEVNSLCAELGRESKYPPIWQEGQA